MDYKRQHLSILKSRMGEPRKRIQIIMGPRQVGKSTLVYQFCDDIDTPVMSNFEPSFFGKGKSTDFRKVKSTP